MLQIGQILHDRYQLQQKLGQNAGRQTWLADDGIASRYRSSSLDAGNLSNSADQFAAFRCSDR